MTRFPTGFGHALSALDLYLGPTPEIAIVGDPQAAGTRALIAEVTARRFLPNHVLAVAPPAGAGAAGRVELLRDRPAKDDKPTAHVCERFVCKLPVRPGRARGSAQRLMTSCPSPEAVIVPSEGPEGAYACSSEPLLPATRSGSVFSRTTRRS